MQDGMLDFRHGPGVYYEFNIQSRLTQTNQSSVSKKFLVWDCMRKQVLSSTAGLWHDVQDEIETSDILMVARRRNRWI